MVCGTQEKESKGEPPAQERAKRMLQANGGGYLAFFSVAGTRIPFFLGND